MHGARKWLQLRQVTLFFKSDLEYGGRVAKGLDIKPEEVKKLATMTQEELVKAML
jgi:hypothetical protein